MQANELRAAIPGPEEPILRGAFIRHLQRMRSRLPATEAHVEFRVPMGPVFADARVTYPTAPPMSAILCCGGWRGEEAMATLAALVESQAAQPATLVVWAAPPRSTRAQREAAEALGIELLDLNLLDDAFVYEPLCWFIELDPWLHLSRASEAQSALAAKSCTLEIDAADLAHAALTCLLSQCGHFDA